MPDFEKLAFPAGDHLVVEAAVRDCAIESVVVYADRAQVKRKVPVSLATGRNEVVVYGLSDCVDQNSIRVEGKGKAVITDVIYSSKTKDHLPSPGSKEKYEALKEEISACEIDVKRLTLKEQVLKDEKKLLDKFASHISSVHSVKGKDDSLVQLVNKDNVIAVMEFFEKYEAKLADLDSRLSKVAEDRRLKQENISVLKENAGKLSPGKVDSMQDTVRSVHVGLETTEEVECVLFVSYVVSQASWRSAYDVRVFTKDKSMKVQYYGFIKQQTGEDWKDAKLSLSTAQPSIGGSPPELPTRVLRFTRAIYIPQYYSAGFVYEYDPTIEFLEDEEPSPMEVHTAKVNDGLFNTTYEILRASSIPADNTEHKVTVALVDLSPDFHYNSVPRLSPHSFLQAKAKNTSPYTMLAGPSNVFMDNNFIAKSELSDVSPNEEFTTSLGVDQSLRITCQPVGVVHNTRSGLRSKTTSITYTHKFQVKNTKSHPVNIHLSEQVPRSSDDKVKVNVAEPAVQKVKVKCPLPSGHALLNESNNMEWHVSVQSGEERELRLIYSVEYPAQDYVEGLPKY